MKIVKDATGSFAGLDVTDFANYLKMTYADDSAQIDAAFYGAANYVDKVGYCQLSQRSLKIISPTWDDGEFEIPYGGTISGTPAITYYGADNASQTLSGHTTFLEQTDLKMSVLHVVKDTLPEVYDREDAISITLTIAPLTTTPEAEIKTCIYQLGAYFYDCRVNDKEPQMTVVEKLVMAVRAKEF